VDGLSLSPKLVILVVSTAGLRSSSLDDDDGANEGLHRNKHRQR